MLGCNGAYAHPSLIANYYIDRDEFSNFIYKSSKLRGLLRKNMDLNRPSQIAQMLSWYSIMPRHTGCEPLHFIISSGILFVGMPHSATYPGIVMTPFPSSILGRDSNP
jgi:hypothetical protein